MALYEFPDSFLDPVKKKNIKKLSSQTYQYTTQHSKKGLELLQREALEGNLPVVQAFFPLFGANLKGEFYQELIKKVVASGGSKNKKLVAICEFFNLNAEPYRIAILEASKTERYSLSKNETAKIFAHLGIYEKLPLNFDCDASLLIRAYCSKDLTLFEMWLRHGADANAWSLTKKGNTGREFYTALNFISCYSLSDHCSYLKPLLFYGANPNFIITKESVASKTLEKLGDHKKSRRYLPKDAAYTIADTNVIAAPPFVFSVDRNDSVCFNLMLPYQSPKVIAYCFSSLATDGQIQTRNFISKEFAAPQFTQNIASIKTTRATDGEFLQCIYYPAGPQNNLLSMLKQMYETLSVKLEKMSENQFNTCYQLLFSRAEEQRILENQGKLEGLQIRFPYFSFSGCLLLLLTRASTLGSNKERIEFLNNYYPALHEKIDSLLRLRYTEPYLTVMRSMYNKWRTNLKESYKQSKKRPTEIENNSAPQMESLGSISLSSISRPEAVSSSSNHSTTSSPAVPYLPMFSQIQATDSAKQSFEAPSQERKVATEEASTEMRREEADPPSAGIVQTTSTTGTDESNLISGEKPQIKKIKKRNKKK